MKERPILFSGEMVRAILEGRKTKARRVIKPQPEIIVRDYGDGKCAEVLWSDSKGMTNAGGGSKNGGIDILNRIAQDRCPYGAPGDRLWVRETWCNDKDQFGLSHYVYKEQAHPSAGFIWRPSIFMPRWASRITLEIVNVRVERVQEISEEDAEAEGVCNEDYFDFREHAEGCAPAGSVIAGPREFYRNLWDSINAKRGYSWDANPYVWVIEFRRIV